LTVKFGIVCLPDRQVLIDLVTGQAYDFMGSDAPVELVKVALQDVSASGSVKAEHLVDAPNRDPRILSPRPHTAWSEHFPCEGGWVMGKFIADREADPEGPGTLTVYFKVPDATGKPVPEDESHPITVHEDANQPMAWKWFNEWRKSEEGLAEIQKVSKE
jgi:hypothetical protein